MKMQEPAARPRAVQTASQRCPGPTLGVSTRKRALGGVVAPSPATTSKGPPWTCVGRMKLLLEPTKRGSTRCPTRRRMVSVPGQALPLTVISSG